LGRSPEAIASFEFCLTMWRKLADKPNELLALQNLAGACIASRDLIRAAKLLSQSLKLAESLKQPVSAAMCLANLGHVRFEQKKFSDALKMHHASLTLAKANNLKRYESFAYGGLARTYFALRDLTNAEAAITKSLAIAEQIGAREFLLQIVALYADIKEAQGNYKAALDLHKRHADLQHALHGVDVYEKIAAEQTRRRAEESDAYRQKIAALEETVRRKNAQLKSLAVSLIQKNEHIKTLEKKTTEKDPINRKSLSPIHQPNTPMKMVEPIGDAYPEFTKELLTRFPTLTRVEVRLCILHRLDLSTKEIANLLYLSPRSVETYRLRLRKKLQLLPTQNVSVFLQGL
jgi:tetratricopeptide (TPR) repeat protein